MRIFRHMNSNMYLSNFLVYYYTEYILVTKLNRCLLKLSQLEFIFH